MNKALPNGIPIEVYAKRHPTIKVRIVIINGNLIFLNTLISFSSYIMLSPSEKSMPFPFKSARRVMIIEISSQTNKISASTGITTNNIENKSSITKTDNKTHKIEGIQNNLLKNFDPKIFIFFIFFLSKWLALILIRVSLYFTYNWYVITIKTIKIVKKIIIPNKTTPFI